MTDFFKKIFKKDNNFDEEKKTVNLKLKIFISKTAEEKPSAPIILLTRKKAKKFKDDLSKAISRTNDYVKINITGELNPVDDTGKDYSFIKIETK